MLHPQLRLRTLLKRSGGITVDEAVGRATANVNELREESRRHVEDLIRGVSRMVASGDPRKRDEIYRCANEVFGTAGLFGWHEISETAYSLCELLSRPGGARKTTIERLHAETLNALIRPELAGRPDARQAVLQGLRRVRDVADDSPA